MSEPDTIWTVGHSTHTIEAFIALIQHHHIEAIADVRRFPGSRRLPHFGEDALRASLAEHGIDYRFIPQLGGRRRAAPDTPNTGWRNASFRGYADHIASKEFENGIEELMAIAGRRRTAMMCAEVLWWRCHRSLVSDVLKLRGIQVLHIQDPKQVSEHPYTAPARLINGRLSYAPHGGEPLNEKQRSFGTQTSLPF